MATRSLALQLGLVHTVDINNLPGKFNAQNFDFLLVLDFEATCWDSNDVNKKPHEIIEFPVIFYDVNRKQIVDEFQQYVKPTESPKLSDFCKNFTGITQQQVDSGVPLATCLMLFNQWIDKQKNQYHISFPNEQQTSLNKCAFVTWSDWDLGTCLKKECKRKRIVNPKFFSSWIDLRGLYIEYYKRAPKGLNGAMLELGLKFVGKEHCGLDDARNTVILAERMMNDGVNLRITKNIELH